MDLFAADQFPVPDRVTPFPDSGSDLLFAADLLSHRHNPQKLRPIRSAVNALPSPPPHTQDPLPSGSGHQSCSSLDAEDEDEDDGNSSASTKGPGSKKKRRKTARKLEDFVKNLVTKVMEKQEQMHKQLVEMIENKERERIKREEAWKNEEMERIRKDEEARAQEKSRNLALISFIQSLLGHEIQIPQSAVEACGKREEDEVEANTPKESNSDPSNNTPKDANNDPSNNRWPDDEVRVLISVRTSLEHKFHLMGSKGSIWEEISEAMHGKGYNRSAKKCKEKWENINKYYKRTIGSGKKRRQNSKTCPYFDELDMLYRDELLSNGNALSNTSDAPQIEEKELGET